LYYASKHEVETLSEKPRNQVFSDLLYTRNWHLCKPHIVDYIKSQGWDEPQVKIFMVLKEGTLESLVGAPVDASADANSVFPQML